MVKAAILRAIDNGAHTTTEIRDTLPHVPYGSLRTSLNRYCKYGYLHKDGTKPYHYHLTPKGQEHAANPFLHRQNFKKKMDGYFNDRLEDEIAETFLDPATIERIAAMHPRKSETIYRTLTQRIPTPVRDKILLDEGARSHPPSVKESVRVSELEEENRKLRKLLASKENDRTKTSEKNIAPSIFEKPTPTKNALARYKIMKKYKDKQLFAKFFDFPEVPYYPYRVVASSSMKELAKYKFQKGEVIILDDRTASKMVEMGHIERLSAKEIGELQFVLQHRPEGFCVMSRTFYIKKLIFDSKNIPREQTKKDVVIVPRER
ncbi:hypothetical protein [Methanolobus profundi]|nr:hypothetical protein [Methanolobus profundi]